MGQKKSVAVREDIKATPASSAQVPPGAMPNSGGQWKAGEITCKSHQKIKVEGKPVIYEAMCTFTYSGGQSADGTTPYPIEFPDPVVLLAKGGKLKENNMDVLLDGDFQSGQFANKLEIKSQRKLKL